MKKKIFLLVVFEFLLVILAAIFCAVSFRNSQQIISFSQEQLIDINNADENEFYVDTNYEDYAKKHIGINNILLDKGTYDIEVIYEIEGDVDFVIEYENKRENYSLGGNIKLAGVKNSQNQSISITRDEQPIEIYCRLNEGNYLLVREIKLTKTFVSYQILLFELLIFFLIVDCLLYIRLRKITIQRESKLVIGGIIGIVIIVSIPLLLDNFFWQHDVTFHLLRIEGLKYGILNGDFPVRIQPHWLNQHGYPVSIFYGDLFLYIPAFFRIIGLTLQASYKCYLIFINALTVTCAYFSFKKIGNNSRIAGIFSSALYTFGLYRMCNIYARGAVGEYTAMAFFPLILYGLWYIFSKDLQEVKKSKVWIVLGIGYLGVLNSHIISCAMIGIFTIIICVIMVKKVFQKERFVALLKAVFLLVFGGASFLIPFIEYRSLDFAVNDSTPIKPYLMEDRGLFGAQFFNTHYDVNAGSNSIYEGMNGEMPLSLGVAFLVIVICTFIICVFFYKAVTNKAEFICAIVLLGIAMWLCTKYFPYTELARLSTFVDTIIKNIQYPWRFLAIVSLISAWLATIILVKVDWKEIGYSFRKIFIYAVGLIMILEVTDLEGQVMNTKGTEMWISDSNLLLWGMMGVPEYLYKDAALGDYVDAITNIGEGVEVVSWERDNGDMILEVSNSSNSEQTLEIPLILYKGHKARETETLQEFELSAGKSNRIVVHLPANYSGTIRVGFDPPWYWHLAELVTAVTYICIIFISFNIHKSVLNRVKFKKEHMIS